MSALLYGSFESFLTPYGLLIDSEHVCQSRHRTSRTPRDTALRLSKPSFSHTYENPLSPAITPFPQHMADIVASLTYHHKIGMGWVQTAHFLKMNRNVFVRLQPSARTPVL